MKLLKLIANLGYGSRREVSAMFSDQRVTDMNGEPLNSDAKVDHASIRLDGQPLDPAPGVLLMLHKPVGYTCSTKDAGRLIYDLLPVRFRSRSPVISPIGRLDRDTSGLLLLTDDGALLHRIISPRSQVAKIYEARLANDLHGDEGEIFASGTLMLESETTPLAPAKLDILEPRWVRLTIHEGRYHQIRRMFVAVGNHVDALHRISIGELVLGDLALGQWREVGADEREKIIR